MFFFLIAVSVFDPCLPNNDNNLTVGIWSTWSRNKLRFSHKNQYRRRVICFFYEPLIHQDFEYIYLWSFVVPGTWVTLTITGDMRSDKTTRQQIESKLFLRSNRFGLHTSLNALQRLQRKSKLTCTV